MSANAISVAGGVRGLEGLEGRTGGYEGPIRLRGGQIVWFSPQSHRVQYDRVVTGGRPVPVLLMASSTDVETGSLVLTNGPVEEEWVRGSLAAAMGRDSLPGDLWSIKATYLDDLWKAVDTFGWRMIRQPSTMMKSGWQQLVNSNWRDSDGYQRYPIYVIENAIRDQRALPDQQRLPVTPRIADDGLNFSLAYIQRVQGHVHDYLGRDACVSTLR